MEGVELVICCGYSAVSGSVSGALLSIIASITGAVSMMSMSGCSVAVVACMEAIRAVRACILVVLCPRSSLALSYRTPNNIVLAARGAFLRSDGVNVRST